MSSLLLPDWAKLPPETVRTWEFAAFLLGCIPVARPVPTRWPLNGEPCRPDCPAPPLGGDQPRRSTEFSPGG
jgi:hypothetical protein